MNSSVNKNQNSGKEKGFFSGLFNAAKNVTSKATAVVTGNNSIKNTKNTKQVVPVTAGVNISTNAPKMMPNNTSPQTGGVAPVGHSIPESQRQPSEAVMNWATTAGIPTPSAAQMRHVSGGGKRRTIKGKGGKRRTIKRKGGKRHKSHKSHKSHNKRRN